MSNIDPATGEVRLDEHGRELLDSRPMEVPLGMRKPETLAEIVQRLVRNQVSQYAAMNGLETFEEAEDLEVDDEFDPSTPYELDFDPVLGREITAADFQDAQKREWLREEYLKAERNAIRSEERQEAIQEAYAKARKEAVQAKANSRVQGAVPPADAPQKAAKTPPEG